MPSIQGLVVGAAARRYSFALLLLANSVPLTAPARGDAPRIGFDFGRTLACREVLLDEAEPVYGDPAQVKVIEVVLQVAVHLLSGDPNDVHEIQVEISDCDRRLRVHRMSPSTQLTSFTSSEIEVTRTVESSHGVGGTLGGELPAVLGDIVAHVTPSVSGNLAKRETVTEKQLQLPPQQVVVASGTIHQQHGALFTLRASPLTTLEGTHELVVQFVAPIAWRADTLEVRCRATGTDKFLWLKQRKVCGSQVGRVALFLAGDQRAQLAAEAFVKR